MEKSIEVIYDKTNKKLKNTTLERANRMIKKQKAEWLEEEEKLLLIQSYDDVKKLKKEFLKDKERICYLCGEEISEDEVSVDHVVPKAHFGQDVIYNYDIAHKDCNAIKGKCSMEEVINKRFFDISPKRAEELLKREKEIKRKLNIQ